MSLDRKDIRSKLPPDIHQALAVLCEADELDIGEWVERVITNEVRRRVHEATVIATACARLGISGNHREKPGMPGNRGE